MTNAIDAVENNASPADTERPPQDWTGVPDSVAIDKSNGEIAPRSELFDMFAMLGGPRQGLAMIIGMLPIEIPSDEALAALVDRAMDGPEIILTATQNGQTFTVVLR